MKYVQKRDESAEILRLVLQKMAAHPAAFTPTTYSVWYEFVSNINPALTSAMEKLLQGSGEVDDAAVGNLYETYVATSEEDIQQRILRKDLQRLLKKLSGFTEETDRQAHDFGDNLQSYGRQLEQNLDAATLGALIGDMADDTNKVRGSIQSLQSELQKSNEEIEKLHRELESAKSDALVDPLTGVLNRRGFEKKIKETVTSEALAAKETCLLMIDIDHFKKINDSYGHLFGDKVIRTVAELLKSKVREQDSVARYGGEEFAVLLPGATLTQAHSTAEKIRRGIEQGKILRTDGQAPIGGITVSIGISALAGNIENLMAQADKALYISKNSGRNKTTVAQ